MSRAVSSVSGAYVGVVSAPTSPQPRASPVSTHTSSASLCVVVLRAVRKGATSGSRMRKSSTARTEGCTARERKRERARALGPGP